MSYEYLSKERMISYYNQVRIIKSLGNQITTILEIGIFNQIFSDLMKKNGYLVTTADVNPELKPDIILDLNSDFELPKDKFDVIVCFQVLEHLPYEAAEKALQKLAEATKKYVAISLPYSSEYFCLRLTNSRTILPRHLFIQIPHFWKTKPICANHCWELGMKGYPKKRFIDTIKKLGLNLKRDYQDPLHPYHWFFAIEKKQ